LLHYPQKLALISPTSGGRSVGIVRLRTKGHGLELRFQSIAAVIMKSTVFWDVMPCNLVRALNEVSEELATFSFSVKE
jgi:hypothetical protein